jgi:hypothetical protein
VGWDGRRLHAPQVPLPAPSVMLGVAVENLSPEATARNTYEVVPADKGGEVADHELPSSNCWQNWYKDLDRNMLQPNLESPILIGYKSGTKCFCPDVDEDNSQQ